MIDLTGPKSVSLSLLAVAAMVIACAALGVVAPVTLPWSILALAGAALIVYLGIRGRVALAVWLWALSFGLLDRWFWMWEVPGFFNLSIERIFFVVVLALFLVHLLWRREPIRLDRPLAAAMVALLVYLAVNITVTGWTGQIHDFRSAPYYRFLSAMLLPFIAFALAYNAPWDERKIRWALIAVTLYGFYSLFISYCQAVTLLGGPNLRPLIWPSYINATNVEGMIHFTRARGAFSSAGPQAVFLVLLFYVDLFLIRRVRGPYRAVLMAQAILTLPALVFTGIRAGFVAFAVAGVIWTLWAARGRFGLAKLAIAALAIVLLILLQWNYVSGQDRLRGGVAEQGPIEARYLLLQQSLRITADHPIFGVGFGHFVEAQRQLRQDPGSEAILVSEALVEHNIFLNMLTETGIVGLTLYVVLFVILFRQSLRLWRSLPPDAGGYVGRGLIALLWVTLAVYLTSGLFRDVMWEPFDNAVLWTLAGLTLGAGRTMAETPEPLAA